MFASEKNVGSPVQNEPLWYFNCVGTARVLKFRCLLVLLLFSTFTEQNKGSFEVQQSSFRELGTRRAR